MLNKLPHKETKGEAPDGSAALPCALPH
jgi:hypothetical protein